MLWWIFQHSTPVGCCPTDCCKLVASIKICATNAVKLHLGLVAPGHLGLVAPGHLGLGAPVQMDLVVFRLLVNICVVCSCSAKLYLVLETPDMSTAASQVATSRWVAACDSFGEKLGRSFQPCEITVPCSCVRHFVRCLKEC